MACKDGHRLMTNTQPSGRHRAIHAGNSAVSGIGNPFCNCSMVRKGTDISFFSAHQAEFLVFPPHKRWRDAGGGAGGDATEAASSGFFRLSSFTSVPGTLAGSKTLELPYIIFFLFRWFVETWLFPRPHQSSREGTFKGGPGEAGTRAESESRPQG